MKVESLGIAGALKFESATHIDARGVFWEAYVSEGLKRATPSAFDAAQINVSVSGRGALRGIHARRPPGEAKYVICVAGSMFDVIVDLRPKSATFRQWIGVYLERGSAVFIGEGLGHAFLACSDEVAVCYATSRRYQPQHEITLDALDSEIGIDWPFYSDLIRSPKDESAPTLARLMNDDPYAFHFRPLGSQAH